MLLPKRLLFITLLCSCVLALLPRQGWTQTDNQRYSQTVWTLEDKDDYREFLAQYAKLVTVYREEIDLEWNFIRFDDGTVEVTMPIRDYADLDRHEAAFGMPRATRTEEELTAIFDGRRVSEVVKHSTTRILEQDAAASYRPAGEAAPAGGYPFMHLQRYTFDGWSRDVVEHARKLPALMKQAGSPLRMDFFTYDIGEKGVFEVTYLAQDRAEYDRQRAANNAALEALPAYRAWQKRARELAKRVHETDGTNIKELSHRPEPATTSLLLTQTVTLLPGREAAFRELLREQAEAYRTTETGAYFNSSRLDNGQYMYSIRHDRLSDVQKLEEKIALHHAKIGTEKSKDISDRFAAQTDRSELRTYIVHHNFSHAMDRVNPRETPFMEANYYRIAPGQRAAALEFLATIHGAMTEANAGNPYAVMTSYLGGDNQEVLVVNYARDAAALRANKEKLAEKLGPAKLAELTAERDRLFRLERTLTGRMAPEYSYVKPAKK